MALLASVYALRDGDRIRSHSLLKHVRLMTVLQVDRAPLLHASSDLSFAKTPSGSQVVDLSALMWRQSQLDEVSAKDRLKKVVGRDGIEPPTPGFSVPSRTTHGAT